MWIDFGNIMHIHGGIFFWHSLSNIKNSVYYA